MSVDLEVGASVFVVQFEQIRLKVRSAQYRKIEKVGRKWLYLEGVSSKVDISKMKSVLEYGLFYQVFKDKSEFDEFDRQRALIDKVKGKLRNFSTIESLGYEKAKKLAEILGVEE